MRGVPVLKLLTQDNETYRNTVRKTIREWYNGVVSKRNQEWMILHVVPKASSGPERPASRFTMKGSVYDKIRADFNSSKKDRYETIRGLI
jgi:trafficking protein particle complex subunit 10